MSGMCSTGHPWLDGVPSCGCDVPSTELPGYVRLTVEPLPAAAARTVITPDPTTSARVSATRVITQVVEPPILSEDGWWQWDGESWIPADTPPTASEPVAAAEPASAAATPAEEVPAWATWSAPVGTAMPAAAAPGVPVTLATPSASTTPAPPVLGAGAVLPPWSGSPQGWQTPPPGWNAPPWPQGERGRDGRAVAALVCSLIPIFLIAQVAALVLAIITLVSVGKSGLKGQVMAIFAIVISVLMFFVSAAIAIPVFLQQRVNSDDVNARIGLRNTANAEETYFTEYGSYAQASQLPSAASVLPVGIEVDVETDGRTRYCLAGGEAGGSRWFLYDSSAGGLDSTRFSSPTAALAACSGAAPTAGSGSNA